MDLRTTTKLILFTGLTAWSAQGPAAIVPAQQPLHLGIAGTKPNIMLMVDNSGSMDSDLTMGVAAVVPGDMPSDFSYSCNNGYVLSGGSSSTSPTSATKMSVDSSGVPRICINSSCTNTTRVGNSGTRKCFDNGKYYSVEYYGGASLGVFLGKNLNWYFRNGTFQTGSLSATSNITDTRINVAKQAANNLVDALIPEAGLPPTVRLGLTTFNAIDNEGGVLLEPMADLNATKGASVKSKITAITTDSWTPLAEILADIGRYFATGNTTGKLTLHPNAGPTLVNTDQIFNNHSLLNSTSATAPIQAACQKSAAILITDGLPTQDRNISSHLADYDGDCSGSNAWRCVAAPSYDIKTAYSSKFGTNSSEYLDDVAKALYEMDLRPDLPKTKPGQKNNLLTYTIGFADPALDPNVTGNPPLLKDTASKGGGLFYYAADSSTLANAVQDAVEDITAKPSSSASVATNSSQLNNDTAIYQGKYFSGIWTGSLLAYPISASEDVNKNGTLDAGEDINNNSKLDGGSLGSLIWNAAANFPAFGSRNIVTYIPYHTGTAGAATLFQCASLSATQKSSLGITDCSSATDHGVWRLNYLRGDWSHEELNTFRRDPDTIRSTVAANRLFRNRTVLDEATRVTLSPDPWVLGDIVNSNPVYVGNEDFGYAKLAGSEGTSYTSFRAGSTYTSRRTMIYVGANDGMLHGFDARLSGSEAGRELFAFIPNSMFTGLSALSEPGYMHRYFVDGSPRVADAYFNSSWHTVLVETTGAGGKTIFALDVTDPDSFGTSKVLWEISSGDEVPNGDTVQTAEFASNLGYTMGQAAIARMADGHFAAIFGNGYASASNKAVLYIVNLENGNLIRAIDTNTGDATTPNGLSTPLAADVNGDKIIDYIYAGDLLGNMWKFDVTNSNASNWRIAFGSTATPEPLYVACAADTSPCPAANRQPITSRPQVGSGPVSTGGYIVLFGTGKYFELVDNDVSAPQTQTFYGILDTGVQVSRRTNLQVQTIVSETSLYGAKYRDVTDTPVNYANKKGWYMDLLPPGSSTSDGERVVSAPLLRAGRIIYSTLRPVPPNDADPCGAGSDGVSWLMEVDSINGSRLLSTIPPWDINGDGKIDSADVLANLHSPAGKQSQNGGHGTPTVISNGRIEYKYTSGSKEGILEVTRESSSNGGAGRGRQSWRQLQ